MTDTTPPARILFDGVLTGDTARTVEKLAEGLNVHDLLADALALGLAQLSKKTDRDDVRVSPWTCNEGGGGFHVLTFVTDGYGNLVAENQAGEELARTPWETEDDESDTHDEFRQLAATAFAKQAAPTTD